MELHMKKPRSASRKVIRHRMKAALQDGQYMIGQKIGHVQRRACSVHSGQAKSDRCLHTGYLSVIARPAESRCPLPHSVVWQRDISYIKK